MYEIKINQGKPFRVEKKEEQLLLNDKPADWSCEPLPDGSFSILYHHRSFRAELVEINKEAKTLVMNIDGRQFEAQITEPIDQVLQAMGLNQRASHKVNQIKAPMPGMVLSILVTEGQELGKGDPVLVLEAMKMENVFKAPADALVKEIRVKEKTAVEKGQVLVIFE
ncbi:MAG TPA: biotin/lipoyl-containing protein [Chitinophagaceae bacterium]|jgi:biotin carboxyl carrier protein|nr:biotin/lipoyl-containing protein [Chitinophagaceae bacterium]